MSVSQVDFAYHAPVLDALEASISQERLSTYLRLAGHDRKNAFQLYLWNADISQAFYLALQTVEVTLRNAISDVLSDVFGENWPFSEPFRALLKEPSILSLEKAKLRLARSGYEITTGRMVAILTFEFWAGILTSDFDRPIWQVRLIGAFPNLPGGLTRGDLRNLVVGIKGFRNRVAHYEPIISSDLSSMHTNILRVVHFRCLHTYEWLRKHSQVQQILRKRPITTTVVKGRRIEGQPLSKVRHPAAAVF